MKPKSTQDVERCHFAKLKNLAGHLVIDKHMASSNFGDPSNMQFSEL